MLVLAFQAKAFGVADYTSDFRIHKMIEGWNKERIRTPDDSSPHLKKVVVSYDPDSFPIIIRRVPSQNAL